MEEEVNKLYGRVDTQPDEKVDRFSIFKNNKLRRNRSRASISRLSFQNDVVDYSRITKKHYQNYLHRSTMNASLLNNTTVNPFLNTTTINQTTTIPFEIGKEICETEEKEKGKKPIPEFIYANIDVNKKFTEMSSLLRQINSLFDEYEKSQKDLKDAKNKYEILLTQLNEAKGARNKVIQEVYQLKTEIDIQNRTITENNLNATMVSNIMTNPGNADIGEQIEIYEDKICKLKVENQAFFENYDSLCDELRENEAQNKKLKDTLAQIDKSINLALKEKNNLNHFGS